VLWVWISLPAAGLAKSLGLESLARVNYWGFAHAVRDLFLKRLSYSLSLLMHRMAQTGAFDLALRSLESAFTNKPLTRYEHFAEG
jgi:hypothetical protein